MKREMSIPKLLSPIRSLEGAKKVIPAGADEVYCAVKIPGIRNLMLNRPPACAISTYDELREIVEYAHGRGADVIVTMELPFMARVLEKKMEEHLHSLVATGPDALIAGDMGIILMIRELGLDIPLFASIFLGSMNYEAVDLLGRIGVDRVILERNVLIDEIAEIVQRNRDVGVEVFIHGGGCSNTQANCYFIHEVREDTESIRKEFRLTVGPPCRNPYEVYEIVGDERRIPDEAQRYMDQMGTSGVPILDAYSFCSICKLPELIRTGVAGLKIVGRCMSLLYQEKVTRMYRDLLDILAEGRMDSFWEMVDILKKGVRWESVPGDSVISVRLPCRQRRCYYEPLAHAPYKLPI